MINTLSSNYQKGGGIKEQMGNVRRGRISKKESRKIFRNQIKCNRRKKKRL